MPEREGEGVRYELRSGDSTLTIEGRLSDVLSLLEPEAARVLIAGAIDARLPIDSGVREVTGPLRIARDALDATNKELDACRESHASKADEVNTLMWQLRGCYAIATAGFETLRATPNDGFAMKAVRKLRAKFEETRCAREALHDAFLRFGTHAADCPSRRGTRECDCGFRSANELARAMAAKVIL